MKKLFQIDNNTEEVNVDHISSLEAFNLGESITLEKYKLSMESKILTDALSIVDDLQASYDEDRKVTAEQVTQEYKKISMESLSIAYTKLGGVKPTTISLEDSNDRFLQVSLEEKANLLDKAIYHIKKLFAKIKVRVQKYIALMLTSTNLIEAQLQISEKKIKKMFFGKKSNREIEISKELIESYISKFPVVANQLNKDFINTLDLIFSYATVYKTPSTAADKMKSRISDIEEVLNNEGVLDKNMYDEISSKNGTFLNDIAKKAVDDFMDKRKDRTKVNDLTFIKISGNSVSYVINYYKPGFGYSTAYEKFDVSENLKNIDYSNVTITDTNLEYWLEVTKELLNVKKDFKKSLDEDIASAEVAIKAVEDLTSAMNAAASKESYKKLGNMVNKYMSVISNVSVDNLKVLFSVIKANTQLIKGVADANK